jgi:lipopolysaccharide assembly outer membrane protein LptD (OstA)
MKFFLQTFLFLILIIIGFVFYQTYFMKKEIVEKIVVENKIKKNDITEKKNIITNLQYNVKLGNNGNYEIKSTSSKIIYENGFEIVFMEGVIATFTDNQNRKVVITSDKASFNSSTYDTKFRDNIKILYENHKITSDKINFDFKKNNILIFQNVIYTGLKEEINTDNIKINLITKDVQFYMDSKKDNVKISLN